MSAGFELSYTVSQGQAETYEAALSALPEIALARVPAADSAGWLSDQDPNYPVRCTLTLPDADTAQQVRVTLEIVAALKGWEEPRFEFRPLADEDWVAKTTANLPAQQVGRVLLYASHWPHRPAPHLWALKIEAGLAFGTGHHETTRGCLSLMQDLVRENRSVRRVLDVGTGSGVLAMAAAKAWRTSTYLGNDIDADSIVVARENARLNQVSHQGRLVLSGALKRKPLRSNTPYDLVFANILASPLIRLSPMLSQKVARGGNLILAGLLQEQGQAVERAYLNRGFSIVKRLDAGQWRMLRLLKRD